LGVFPLLCWCDHAIKHSLAGENEA
jgi:hypothetical protein